MIAELIRAQKTSEDTAEISMSAHELRDQFMGCLCCPLEKKIEHCKKSSQTFFYVILLFQTHLLLK